MSAEEATIDELHHYTDRELEALVEEAQGIMRRRESERRRRQEMERQLRSIGI